MVYLWFIKHIENYSEKLKKKQKKNRKFTYTGAWELKTDTSNDTPIFTKIRFCRFEHN